MNIGFCRVAILDNILMYEKNLDLLDKLSKDDYELVYVGSELRELLDIEDLNLDILVIGNLGSKDYMNFLYEEINNHLTGSRTKMVYILSSHDISSLFQKPNNNIYGIITYDEWEDILHTLNSVKNGSKYISLKLHKSLIDSLFYERNKFENVKEVYLSSMGKEVLNQLAKGYRYSEIATNLNLSIDSTRYYIKEIYSALGVNNKAGAVGKLLRNEVRIAIITKTYGSSRKIKYRVA